MKLLEWMAYLAGAGVFALALAAFIHEGMGGGKN